MTVNHPLADYLSELKVDVDSDEKTRIIDAAVNNLISKKAFVVGFSGKKAAGKDTLAHGFEKTIPGTSSLTQISTGIKDEATEMFKDIYLWLERENEIRDENLRSGNASAGRDISGLDSERSFRFKSRFGAFAKKFNATAKNAETIYSTAYPLLKNKSGVTGYNRENEVISVLQYLGKDVRQPQDSLYWTRKMLWQVAVKASKEISSFVPDVRFLHDAMAVSDIGGFVIRLDITKAEQLARLKIRDGVDVSDAVLNHPSETALDDYEGFNLRLATGASSPEEIHAQAEKAWLNFIAT